MCNDETGSRALKKTVCFKRNAEDVNCGIGQRDGRKSRKIRDCERTHFKKAYQWC